MTPIPFTRQDRVNKENIDQRVLVLLQIEMVQAQLDFLLDKLRVLGGPVQVPKISTRYRRLRPIQAICQILRDCGKPMSIEDLTRALVENGNEIGETSDPEGNTRRSVVQGEKFEHLQKLKDGRYWLKDEPVPDESE